MRSKTNRNLNIPAPLPPQSVRTRLAKFYKAGGWVHSKPDPVLRAKHKDNYKRGYEVRIAVASKRELADLRATLKKAGFKVGSPFVKVNRTVQPVYGKKAVDRLMQIVKAGK